MRRSPTRSSCAAALVAAVVLFGGTIAVSGEATDPHGDPGILYGGAMSAVSAPGPTPAPAPAPADSAYAIPEFRADTVFVTRKAITIREIIERATRGERTKLAGHDNMTYTMTTREIIAWKKKRIVTDKVYRAYVDTEGNHVQIQIGEESREYKMAGGAWVQKPDKDKKSNVRAQIETEGYDDFVNLPFYLEDVSDYDFVLLGRTREVDRVIFKIGFEPRSEFKALPSGVVYVDTKDYQIIHEEFTFASNPAPLFLKGIKRISRQWTELPTGEWVFTKIMGEIELRGIPFFPGDISIALIREDFRFDEGYDPRLFGDMPAALEAGRRAQRTAARARPAVPATRSARTPDPARTDSGTLLETLQRNDDAFFMGELLEVNTALRDTTISRHDSLGLDAYVALTGRGAGPAAFTFVPASHLFDYNRVEGEVSGAGAALRLGPRRRAEVRFEGGYAAGSKSFRHYERITVPVPRGRWRVGLSADWGEHVVPYGSNRPAWNGLRALLGGADRRDYLEREGGGASLSLRHRSGFEVAAGFETARERSIEGRVDFAVVDKLDRLNAPIDDGSDRAVTLGVSWSPDGPSRLRAALGGRLAGGALGGDFEYARTDASLTYRRHLVGRHEGIFSVGFATLGGNPPVQRLADVGGLSTVRGYDRRSRVGETSIAGRLEYPLPYNVLARTGVPLLRYLSLQPVAWADAGRVWNGNADSAIYSFGVGLQLYLGPFGGASNLRFDISFPRGAGRADDVRYDLHFVTATF